MNWVNQVDIFHSFNISESQAEFDLWIRFQISNCFWGWIIKIDASQNSSWYQVTSTRHWAHNWCYLRLFTWIREPLLNKKSYQRKQEARFSPETLSRVIAQIVQYSFMIQLRFDFIRLIFNFIHKIELFKFSFCFLRHRILMFDFLPSNHNVTSHSAFHSFYQQLTSEGEKIPLSVH